jgi:hypothetical protein
LLYQSGPTSKKRIPVLGDSFCAWRLNLQVVFSNFYLEVEPPSGGPIGEGRDFHLTDFFDIMNYIESFIRKIKKYYGYP